MKRLRKSRRKRRGKSIEEELKRKDRENRMMLKESIVYKLQKEAEKVQREAVREVILTARKERRLKQRDFEAQS